MPNFSQSQLDLLRDGLLRAQKRFAIDGTLASFEHLVERIREAPQDEALDLADGSYDLRAEVLRRFTEGSSPMTPAKQRAVRSFLIVSDLITNEEFDTAGEEDAAVFAVYSRLANSSPAVRTRLEALCLLQRLNGNEEIDLRLYMTADETNDFCRVVEVTSTGTWREKLRTGYAFLSTPENLLHVFVCGDSARDRVHYVQICESDVSPPILLRVGDERIAPIVTSRVFRFQPDTDPG